jgi:6-phosphogluconolactonase
MPLSPMLASGYSAGFWNLTYDESSGLVTQRGNAALGDTQGSDMSFTVFDDRTSALYAVHENENVVSRWTIGADGILTKQESRPVTGTTPAHVALSTEHNLLFVANYGGQAGTSSVVVYAIDPETGGRIDDESTYFEHYPLGSGVVPDRQESSHAHGAFIYGNFVYVVDLGGDKIFVYKMVPGSTPGRFVVEKGPEVACGPGVGPRHMAVDEKRGRAYVINELVQSVSAFEINASTGNLTPLGDAPYAIEDATDGVAQSGAGIVLHPNGNALYASIRGDGAIVVYAVSDASPYLAQIQTARPKGTWPRFIMLASAQHLLVPDEFKSTVDVFQVDEADRSKLSLIHSELPCGQRPTAIVFVGRQPQP